MFRIHYRRRVNKKKVYNKFEKGAVQSRWQNYWLLLPEVAPGLSPIVQLIGDL